MYCIGVSYRKTPASIRERFAFSDEEKEKFISRIIGEGHIEACVILSTCNRSEIYFSVNETAEAEEINYVSYIENKLHSFKEIPMEDVKEECLVFSGRKADKHLFNVCCGLDSMVLGEVEIIRQIKDAYQYSFDKGYVNKEINIVFQAALNASKEIQSKTKLAYCPVSIGTLTVKAIEEFTKQKASANVLIVGASGKTGSIVIKNLLDMKNQNLQIVGTGRNPKMLRMEYEEYSNVKIASYDERYNYIDWADVIVSATSSPHYTFVSEKCRKRYEDTNKKRLYIDLAVPRDIDKDIDKLENITLKDIDYFNKLAKANNEAKISESNNAKEIINEKLEELEKNMLFQNLLSSNKLPDKLKENNSGMWLLYQLRDSLDIESFEKVINVLEEI